MRLLQKKSIKATIQPADQGMFRRLLTAYVGKSTEMNLMHPGPQKRNLHQIPMGIPKSLYRCAGGLGSQFLFKAYKHVIEGGPIRTLFASSRTVIIPKSSDVDNSGPFFCEIAERFTSVDTAIVTARFSLRRFSEAFKGTP